MVVCVGEMMVSTVKTTVEEGGRRKARCSRTLHLVFGTSRSMLFMSTEMDLSLYALHISSVERIYDLQARTSFLRNCLYATSSRVAR